MIGPRSNTDKKVIMSPRPMNVHNDESTTIRIPWLSMAATVLIAAAILIVFRPGLQRWSDSSGPRASAGPRLRATPSGEGVQIWWPPGTHPSDLSVQDGGVWHRIELNADEVATGRYLYRPSSAEVLIRMDAETVRVMGLAPHPEPSPPPVVEVAKEEPAPVPAPVVQTADRVVASSPEIADRKVPAPFPKALRTVHGSIRIDVQVAIAADGSVQSAEVLTPARSPYFNRLSLAAAQGSRFKPGADGSSIVLRYEYSRAGVEVSQATP